MSTVATPVDEQAVKESIARVRDDTPGCDRRAWMLLGHVEGNPNSIDLIGILLYVFKIRFNVGLFLIHLLCLHKLRCYNIC